MKKIPLSQGKFTLVDDADFEWLSQWKWHAKRDTNTFYAVRNTEYLIDNGIKKRRVVQMHRQILGLTDPKIYGEHWDGDGLNNQRSNLRPATNSENQKNKKPRGTSKYLGVSWSKSSRKWISHIAINGKAKHLGLFTDEIQAALKYNEYARIHHGDFARLNEIPE
jgi:hypothetical protein